MEGKICLRSGQCCSGHFAFVPKTEDSDLSPDLVDNLPFDTVNDYLQKHAEPMDTPCKWLVRDEETTEATCKVHSIKSSQCRDYPEYLVGGKYCNAGLAYWRHRQSKGLAIPEWVGSVLSTVKR